VDLRRADGWPGDRPCFGGIRSLPASERLRQAAILLAGQAETELADGYHDRAVLLALEALKKLFPTPGRPSTPWAGVSYSPALQQYTSHQSAVTSVAWSPDGKLSGYPPPAPTTMCTFGIPLPAERVPA